MEASAKPPAKKARGEAAPAGSALSWKSLVGSEEFSDVRFILDDGSKFFAHRNMLAVRSPVFHAMLRNDFVEKDRGEIKVEGVTRTTMEAFLMFVYTLKLDICKALIGDDCEAVVPLLTDIMKLSHRYNVNAGSREVDFKNFIKKQKLLVVETVIDFFQVARLLEMKLIQELCVEFMEAVVEPLTKHESCTRAAAQDPSFIAEFVKCTRTCLFNRNHFHDSTYVKMEISVSFQRNSEALFDEVDLEIWAQPKSTVWMLAEQLAEKLEMFQKYRREGVKADLIEFHYVSTTDFVSSVPVPVNYELHNMQGWRRPQWFSLLALVKFS